MSTTDDILDAARKRLAAIPAERAALDAEEAKLRRMLAAAEQPEPVKLMPLPVAPAPFPPWPPPGWPPPMPVMPYFPPVIPIGEIVCGSTLWHGPVDIEGRQLPCGSGMTLADAVTWLETGLAGATVPQDALLTRSNGVRLDQPLRVGDTSGCIDDSGRRYGLS